jgi:hypothetical protein
MAEKAKDNILRESLFESFQGLDTVSALTNMQPGYLRTAKNCNLTDDGAIDKRQGCQYQNEDQWVGGSIIWGGIHFVSDIADEVVVYGTDGSAGQLGRYTGGSSITNITTSLSYGKPTMLQFGQLLFVFTGSESQIYDGVGMSQIGITPPVVAPTDGGDTAGGLVNTTNYFWVYTYYNSITGAESSPSAPLGVIVTPSGGRIIGVTPGDPTTANFIRLYRTTSNGTILFLETQAGIASTTINSVLPDLGLSTELEIDNTQLDVWGTPRYGTISGNRIFLTGFGDNPNRVRFSKIGKSGAMPESYQATAFADCESLGGLKDKNIGIGQANDTIIILKPNSVGALNQLGTINTDIAVDNVVYEYTEISRAVTGLSHWGICNVYTNMVWMGSDNFYMTDGKQAIPIGDTIANLISSIVFEEDSVDAYNDLTNKRVYFSALVKNPAIDDVELAIERWIFVGTYRKFPEFKWTVYTPGTNRETHPGIAPACFIAYGKDTYFGSGGANYITSSSSGRIVKMNEGYADVLEPESILGIYFQVRDYPSKFNLDEEPKLWFKDFIHLGTNISLAYSIKLYSIYDLSDTLEDPYTLKLNEEFGRFDISNWNQALWAYNRVRYEYSTHKKAVYKQIEFQNYKPNEPIRIYGYIKCARPENFK